MTKSNYLQIANRKSKMQKGNRRIIVNSEIVNSNSNSNSNSTVAITNQILRILYD